MFRMHEESCKFILIHLKPEQYPKSHIVDTAFHGAVHRFRMVSIVVLRTRWVERLIALLVVRFLKQDVGTDACFF